VRVKPKIDTSIADSCAAAVDALVDMGYPSSVSTAPVGYQI
jgi:hypothetical protein